MKVRNAESEKLREEISENKSMKAENKTGALADELEETDCEQNRDEEISPITKLHKVGAGFEDAI